MKEKVERWLDFLHIYIYTHIYINPHTPLDKISEKEKKIEMMRFFRFINSQKNYNEWKLKLDNFILKRYHFLAANKH